MIATVGQLSDEDDDRKQFIDVPFAAAAASFFFFFHVHPHSHRLDDLGSFVEHLVHAALVVAHRKSISSAVACTARHMLSFVESIFSSSSAQCRRFRDSRFVYDPSASRFIINATGIEIDSGVRASEGNAGSLNMGFASAVAARNESRRKKNVKRLRSIPSDLTICHEDVPEARRSRSLCHQLVHE